MYGSKRKTPPRDDGGRFSAVYKPEFCDRVIEYGEQGWTQAEMAAAFMVSKGALSQWIESYPEFKSAIALAKTLSEAYGARKARENWQNPKFNTPLWARYMANCHGWRSDTSQPQAQEAGSLTIVTDGADG